MSQNSHFINKISGNVSGYDADYQEVLDLATAQGFYLPDITRLDAGNNWMLFLKSSGLYHKKDVKLLFSWNDVLCRNLARICWKRKIVLPQYGNLNYTVEGFKGNNVDGWIDVLFVPLNDGVNYKLEDASRGYVLYDNGTNAAKIGGSENGTRDVFDATTGTNAQRINFGSVSSPATGSDLIGFQNINRTSINDTDFIVNDTQTNHTNAGSGVSLSDITIALFKRNLDKFGDAGLSTFHMGAAMTFNESVAYRTAYNEFRVAVGLPSINSDGLDETHVFLLAGQSNMIGRDNFDNGSTHPANVLMWSDSLQQLVAPTNPLEHENPINGDMGLDITFSQKYLQLNPNCGTLILIPSAKGSTGFNSGSWQQTGLLYGRTFARANTVMALDNTYLFKGILWHQGESDIDDSTAFIGHFDDFIDNIRTDITDAGATTPIIVGGLNEVFVSSRAATTEVEEVQAHIEDTPNRFTYTAYVSSVGIANGDNVHFSAQGYRDFGERYADAVSAAEQNTSLI